MSNLLDHMSFGSPKWTHCLNLWDIRVPLLRIPIATSLHQQWPPSTVTLSIGIYDHFRVSPIGQSFLLALAWTRYPLKVEIPCSIVAWWIMTIDSLMSWFTIGLVQCTSHALVHSPWENHPDSQDKLSLQLGGSVLQSQMDSLNTWTNCGQLITIIGIHDLNLLCNS